MLGTSHHLIPPDSAAARTALEQSIREDFERCHPGETLDDVRRRAAFTKEDKGLYRHWLAVAAARARISTQSLDAAA
jgi:hypothetical protein